VDMVNDSVVAVRVDVGDEEQIEAAASNSIERHAALMQQ
jgi:hypothetical protein